MSVQNLLSRLEKVTQTGPGKWVACCPAHSDKRPSLAITEKSDGRTLFYCHAGCPQHEVISAVGLTFSDLQPGPIDHHLTRVKRPFSAQQLLMVSAFEALTVALSAVDLARGAAVTPELRKRLIDASSRLQRAASWIS